MQAARPAVQYSLTRGRGEFQTVYLAFQVRSRKDVDTFHRLALGAGGRSNGASGLRPYHDRYYAAFVLDPDGNNIEAVCDAPTVRNVDSVIVEIT
ncbi:hypothetical protein ASG42_30595 [Rhizobium sp. Leaf391]|nr:hypothetical protein ASG42_30595 [Rhizobium sp. Leaf391]